MEHITGGRRELEPEPEPDLKAVGKASFFKDGGAVGDGRDLDSKRGAEVERLAAKC